MSKGNQGEHVVDLDLEGSIGKADFDLDDGDDRIMMIARALDYTDPSLGGKSELAAEFFSVDPELAQEVDDSAELFGQRLVNAGGLYELGSGMNDGFSVLTSGQLKGREKSGRIPRTVKTAEDFTSREEAKRAKGRLPTLDEVLAGRAARDAARNRGTSAES